MEGFSDGGFRRAPYAQTGVGAAAWFVDATHFGASARIMENSTEAEFTALRDLLVNTEGQTTCYVDQQGLAGDAKEVCSNLVKSKGIRKKAVLIDLVEELQALVADREVTFAWNPGHGSLATIGTAFCDHLERYTRQLLILQGEEALTLSPKDFPFRGHKRPSPLGLLLTGMYTKQLELGLPAGRCLLGHSEGNAYLLELTA